jgi:cobaltochelatase CobN
MSDFTDHMLLWDVTTPDLVSDRDWQEVADVYVRDRYKLGLKTYFAKSNPAARRKLIETLLEAADRGRWRTDTETLRALRRELAGPESAPAPGSRPARQGGGDAPGALVTPPLRGFEMQEVVRPTHATAAAASHQSHPLMVLLASFAALLLLAGAVRQPAW